MTVVLLLLLLTAVSPALTLLLRRRWVDPTLLVAGCALTLLGAAALVAALVDHSSDWRVGAAAVLGVAAATTAGSDVVRACFRVSRHDFDLHAPRHAPRRISADGVAPTEPVVPPPAPTTSTRSASVLRGGVWIGFLERAAISSTLLAGWPEGIALVLAVKGVGRYPELRGSQPGETDASEEFIIGTLVSVLWAAAAAGTAQLVR